MKVMKFVELNRRRLELYCKVTRALALVISLMAVVFLTGGMIRSFLDPDGIVINRYGFMSGVHTVVLYTLRFLVSAFTAFAVGEYLHYLVRDDEAPRFAPKLLPAALLLVAVAGLYRFAESIYRIAKKLVAGVDRDIIFTTFVDLQIPALTRSVATIGMAIIIVHLTRVIEEEKALV